LETNREDFLIANWGIDFVEFTEVVTKKQDKKNLKLFRSEASEIQKKFVEKL
jgi:hypothetical protein